MKKKEYGVLTKKDEKRRATAYFPFPFSQSWHQYRPPCRPGGRCRFLSRCSACSTTSRCAPTTPTTCPRGPSTSPQATCQRSLSSPQTRTPGWGSRASTRAVSSGRCVRMPLHPPPSSSLLRPSSPSPLPIPPNPYPTVFPLPGANIHLPSRLDPPPPLQPRVPHSPLHKPRIAHRLAALPPPTTHLAHHLPAPHPLLTPPHLRPPTHQRQRPPRT